MTDLSFKDNYTFFTQPMTAFEVLHKIISSRNKSNSKWTKNTTVFQYYADVYLLLGQHIPELLHADLKGDDGSLSRGLDLRLYGCLLTYVDCPLPSVLLLLRLLGLHPEIDHETGP